MNHTLHALADLLKGVAVLQSRGDLRDTQVQSISFDSRNIQPSSVFFALRGHTCDGHDYITEAVARGSTAVVCERLPRNLPSDIPYVVVSNSAVALGTAAANFYRHPSTQLKLVAVTGTNGKTSTVQLLAHTFRQLGERVGVLSTIGNWIHDVHIPATFTTPDVIQTNRLLAQMVSAGCAYGFMEASSQAICQQRMAGLHLAGAVFSNITHEHLDYHGTFQRYMDTKKSLFDRLPAQAFAVFNADDKHGAYMIQNCGARRYSFALKKSADFQAKRLTSTLTSTTLQVENQQVECQLGGTFNAYNLLATYATACLLEQDPHRVLVALSGLKSIPGRLQYVSTHGDFEAIVDYAHTPDAVRHVLKSVRNVVHKPRKIIAVLGCGGNRDKAKRPLMGRLAAGLSDHAIFTADNPRYECLEAILQDMCGVLTQAERKRVLLIQDRTEAIYRACSLASKGDVVLVMGKGHETYQEVRGIRMPHDDTAVLRRFIKPT